MWRGFKILLAGIIIVIFALLMLLLSGGSGPASLGPVGLLVCSAGLIVVGLGILLLIVDVLGGYREPRPHHVLLAPPPDYRRLEISADSVPSEVLTKPISSSDVKKAIDVTGPKLEELKAIGILPERAEVLLSEAERAFGRGELDIAYVYADEAFRDARTTLAYYTHLREMIFYAEKVIETAKRSGMAVRDIESKLVEAISLKDEDPIKGWRAAHEAIAIGTANLHSSGIPLPDVRNQ